MSKRQNILFWFFSAILCLALFLTYQRFDFTKNLNSSKVTKIITLVPSVQEMVSSIDGEKLIIGVSNHSVWPESIKKVEKIAGFSGVDYERLSKLSPDIVFDSGMIKEASKKLEKIGIKYVELKENSVDDILNSIKIIGNEIGLKNNAERKIKEIKSIISKFKKNPKKNEKMLIVVGCSDELKNLYIAGKNNLFDELITLSGYNNGYEGEILYPCLSAENLVNINADVVVILNEKEKISNKEKEEIIKPWMKLPINASKNGRIHILNGNGVFIPGPRFVQTLEKLSSY
ncbi:MAG: helical backbone metal receptor [Candidatus Muirbacterium halophilum]|nr:helical backbone metal receptor [Candidatus Muirbacterium halophilum]MCK9476468.1 helical backbone metal receptor [Candidatus Muirbacterium halophilum]